MEEVVRRYVEGTRVMALTVTKGSILLTASASQDGKRCGKPSWKDCRIGEA